MKKKYRKNKHGLPLLDNDDLFAKNPEEASFNELANDILGESAILAASVDKKDPGLPVPRHTMPTPSLDLHGITAQEAEIASLNFITTSRILQRRRIRIITGKGLHSQGTPVLPHAIEQFLRLQKQKGVITGYQWENGRREESGAVLVFLAQK